MVLATGDGSASSSSIADGLGEDRGHVVDRRDPAGRRLGHHVRHQPRRRPGVGGDDHRAGLDHAVRGVDRPGRHAAHLAAEPHAARGQVRGDLLGQPLHAAGGDRRLAAHEHPHHQVGEPPRRRHVVLQQHPGEERPQHAVHDVLRDVGVPPGLGRAQVVAVQEAPRGQGRAQPGVQPQRRLAQDTAHRQAQRGQRPAGPAHRVRHADPVAVDLETDGGVERPQVQRGQVDEVEQGRVGGVQHLEAAVEGVAVQVVGADPAADRVTRLQHEYVETAGGQGPGAGEAGEAGTDHDDVGGLAGRGGLAQGRLRWA